MIKKQNKNDVPLETLDQLKGEILYENFEFHKHFDQLSIIRIDNEKERLIIAENQRSNRFDDTHFVYLFVIGRRIFKIGSTITSIKKRIQSYNCGKRKYREDGTCSTTNFFILQSLLNIKHDVTVYAHFPNKHSYTYFGIKFQEASPSPKAVERIILKKFQEKYDRLPIGCTQQ